QAEDGIRDDLVTGVQTCALPISRAALAAILTADVGTVALTHSATEAMNVAAWGLDWEPGDRAVTTTLEHVGALGPLLTLRDRREIGRASCRERVWSRVGR